MLRASRVVKSGAGAVLPLVRASDAAFSFPRYHPSEHLTAVLPELAAAKEALLPYPVGQPEAPSTVLSQLDRAQEIFENLQGSSPSAMAKDLRFVIASKLRVLQAPSAASSSLCNTPGGIHQKVLRDTSVALASTDWEASDAQFDAMCVVVGAYVRSFSQVHRSARFDPSIASSGMQYAAEERRTLENAIAWCKQLQGHAVRETKGIAVRKYVPALQANEAALVLALEGNFVQCTELLRRAVQVASDFTRTQQGMFGAMDAELLARYWGWSYGPGFADEEVVRKVGLSHKHYSALFGHPSLPPERELPIDEITAGFEDLRDSFCATLVTAAQFYLQAPHDRPEDDWMPPELLSYSPFYTMPSGGGVQRETSVKIDLPHKDATRRALQLSERALKVHRRLFPDDRENLKAAEILRTMGIAYADLGDYLYATGMWNAAKRIYDKHFGPFSRESIDIMRLLECFQRKVKSTKEADATKHQLDGILEQFHSK